jgi:large subunit ribosomal protein L15
MDLSDLKPAKGATHSSKRVGRGQGSGNGKTAGRGHKGAKSRSGFKRKRGFEGGQMPLHRRLPKRGFTNIFRSEYAVINLDQLEKLFEGGADVNPEVLHGQGLAQGTQKIKVLGRGELTKVLNVKAHKFSGAAAQKIQAAGGTAESL